MEEPLFRKVDCVRLPVSNLDDALRFYRDTLGHQLRWRTASAVGLAFPGCDAELVLHTEGDPPEVDLLVDSVPAAIESFKGAGGTVISGPFQIAIGECAIVSDPWANRLVILDTTKGLLVTDSHGDVIRRVEE